MGDTSGDTSGGTSAGGGDKQRVTVVTETGEGGYAQRVTVGPHELAADEPASDGGTDAGPSPYDLLLASLGTCTSMTIRMFAQRREWPLRGITVRLRHSRIHAADCENCETESGRVDYIRREIELDGDLDADQRAKLMEIADKCPVHRTLRSEVAIDTHPVGAP
ncbi:putative redox protein [Lipingzhangella halophila]|uniref:Putative redox protein n=1 Tax=Lipingzhangella halophila TaxID=1783352 RepID=A0A7W7W3A4_9ACTN|nr:OsmC family protein [Lipingzhangella halophila]MBB4931604.1 putative redox protein [Lipingzhangella halophila]